MAAYAQPPAPGTVVFHNEAETWQPVQPSIGADDVAADGRALKLMIAAGAGLPEHYLAEGGHVNRATAAEMGLPTLRRFQRRQELFGRYLRRLVARAIQARQDAGALPTDVDTSFRVVFQGSPAGYRPRGGAARGVVRALAAACENRRLAGSG